MNSKLKILYNQNKGINIEKASNNLEILFFFCPWPLHFLTQLTLSVSGSYSRYPTDVRPWVTIQALNYSPTFTSSNPALTALTTVHGT